MMSRSISDSLQNVDNCILMIRIYENIVHIFGVVFNLYLFLKVHINTLPETKLITSVEWLQNLMLPYYI